MIRRVLLLGGLDPSGGAGITVDAAVAMLHGVAALPIAITNTVQSQRGFVRVERVPVALWREQVAAVLADGPVHAIKLGLAGDTDTVDALATLLAECRGAAPVVVDPVLSATAGGFTAPLRLAAAYRERLVPLAHLVTPNAPELAALASGGARELLRAGAHAVLHKGGHQDGATAVDELHVRGADEPERFVRARHACGPVRGTGCALATAIAARLAAGVDLAAACRLAGDWLNALLARLGPPPADGLPRRLPLAAIAPVSRG